MSSGLKIGILGTRGIPNRYGGFEQCAEYLAAGLVQKGHQVWVYNAHNHDYQKDEWNGVQIIHCNDPENKMGTAGQFIYDLNCLLDARKRKFDILLQLGYTSSSIWYWLWPGKQLNIVNMDGLEWKRSKYSAKVQRFLKLAEQLAANHGDVLIADSIGIQEHLKFAFGKPSVFIPYGAEVFEHPDVSVPGQYGLQPGRYHVLVARMEPENNIEMIIRGVLDASTSDKLMVIGKTENKFGQYLLSTYGKEDKISFAGGIYDSRLINNLRYHSLLYFHGHSVGGTNPSLLEAMGCRALIAAHDNVFNRSILGDDAFYFSSSSDIASVVAKARDKESYSSFLEHNVDRIHTTYNWPLIVDQYENTFVQAMASRKSRQ